MRTTSLFCLAASALALSACTSGSNGLNAKANLNNKIDSASYAIGFLEGTQLTDQFSEMDLNNFWAGFSAAQKKDTANFKFKDPQEAMMFVRQYMMDKQQKEAMENLEKGTKFLSDIAKKEGVKKLDSADIYYEVITEGNGAKPSIDDQVEVHYTGTLIDGTKFDSSVDRGQPITFPLRNVIRGWQLTLQAMPVGSKWKVYIPSDLGYGPRGAQAIPPNSTLIFEIELLQIIKAEDDKTKK